jgi:hypothetical protein
MDNYGSEFSCLGGGGEGDAAQGDSRGEGECGARLLYPLATHVL